MKGRNTNEGYTLLSLSQITMKKRWKEVAEFYKTHSWAHKARLTKSEETALHVAVSSYHSRRVDPNLIYYIKRMIDDCIPENDLVEVLSMHNDKGNTPLHLAATVGWVAICKSIALKHRKLISIRNLKGETPLFRAARNGKTEAFLCLHQIYNDNKEQEPDESLCRRTIDGNTILHSAISGAHFSLAHQIISYYPKLVHCVTVDGESPLHFLAKKPNVFKSCSHLGLYESIVYHCLLVEELKIQKYNPEAADQNDVYFPTTGSDINYPENYRTCVNIFRFLWNPIQKIIKFALDKDSYRSNDEEKQLCIEEMSKENSSFPANYATCISFFKFSMKVIPFLLGMIGFSGIKKIQDKKQLHSHALHIMNQIINLSELSSNYGNDGKNPSPSWYSHALTPPNARPLADEVIASSSTQTKEIEIFDPVEESHIVGTPLLVAVKMGILEMVEKILITCPIAIQEKDSNGKNVLLLATDNKKTSVFDYLIGMDLPEYMFYQADNKSNGILHLAANLGESQPWNIPGAALQMQLEIKWYKHVQSSIPRLSFSNRNIMDDTPRTIFTKTHDTMMKEGTRWLIKTSESCSVIAALIATVAFATSATVPGGVDDKSGYPVFRDRRAFDVFSISSLMALCLSVTAIVFFLAIITSRFQVQDFSQNLPRKLLMGLTSLFASIAAMLVSFTAGHTFILREKLRIASIPIYASACIPVTIFVIAQLPLYLDLLRAAWGKVPLRSYQMFDPQHFLLIVPL